ncbi:Zinc ABC transporter, ATP-binding protein ZnuC [Leucobacter sp. 7(1)]|uniref:ATP-binding cassette domain-containing protein n=1 Tax=Leucobacter sp. 7(1) TaxID=1255613 RepID=UPI00097F360A|nr:ATP-binding cassette domain-containing protein [Leucobacter sp. 7(1)]SJN07947.1 Zinc ABC transporter, ATP-binding protein ZnuC [Leucobacter sp. 7(1)]
MEHDTAIRAAGIHARYGHTPVLTGIDLSVPWGTVTVISGPNGAGKSTLLEILAGVRAPYAGTVHRASPVALVVQRPLAPPGLPLTVADAVTIGAARPGRRAARSAATSLARVPRRSRREIAAAVSDALAAVDLAGFSAHDFASLSGGQRQRVLIAQGLATGAQILLLDEPAAGLDAASRARTREILAASAQRGVSVCCVSHDPEDIAAADRLIRLDSMATA